MPATPCSISENPGEDLALDSCLDQGAALWGQDEGLDSYNCVLEPLLSDQAGVRHVRHMAARVSSPPNPVALQPHREERTPESVFDRVREDSGFFDDAYFLSVGQNGACLKDEETSAQGALTVAQVLWDPDNLRTSFVVEKNGDESWRVQNDEVNGGAPGAISGTLAASRPERPSLGEGDTLLYRVTNPEGKVFEGVYRKTTVPYVSLAAVREYYPFDLEMPVINPRDSLETVKRNIREIFMRTTAALIEEDLLCLPIIVTIPFVYTDYDDLVEARLIEGSDLRQMKRKARNAFQERAQLEWFGSYLESIQELVARILEDFPYLAGASMVQTLAFDEGASGFTVDYSDLQKEKKVPQPLDISDQYPVFINGPYFKTGQLDLSALPRDVFEEEEEVERPEALDAKDQEPLPAVSFPKEEYESLIRSGLGGVSDVDEVLDMLARVGEPWQTMVHHFRRLVHEREEAGESNELRGLDGTVATGAFPVLVQRTNEPATFLRRGDGSLRDDLGDSASFNGRASFLAVVHEILAHALPIKFRHPDVAAIPYWDLDDIRATGREPTFEETYVYSVKSLYADEAMATLSEAFAYRDLLRAGVPRDWFYSDEEYLLDRVLRIYEHEGLVGYLRSELYIGRNHRSSYTKNRVFELAVEAATNTNIVDDASVSIIASHLGIEPGSPALQDPRFTSALQAVQKNPSQATAMALVIAASQTGVSIQLNPVRIIELMQEQRSLERGAQTQASTTFLAIRSQTSLQVQVLSQGRQHFERYRLAFEKAWDKAGGDEEQVKWPDQEGLVHFYRMAVLMAHSAEAGEQGVLNGLVGKVYAVLSQESVLEELLDCIAARLKGRWIDYREGMKAFVLDIEKSLFAKEGQGGKLNPQVLFEEFEDAEAKAHLVAEGVPALLVESFFSGHEIGLFENYADTDEGTVKKGYMVQVAARGEREESSTETISSDEEALYRLLRQMIVLDDTAAVQRICEGHQTKGEALSASYNDLVFVQLSIALWGVTSVSDLAYHDPLIGWLVLREKGPRFMEQHAGAENMPGKVLDYAGVEDSATDLDEDALMTPAYFSLGTYVLPSQYVSQWHVSGKEGVFNFGYDSTTLTHHQIEFELETLERRGRRRELRPLDFFELGNIVIGSLSFLKEESRAATLIKKKQASALLSTQQALRLARFMAVTVGVGVAFDFLRQAIDALEVQDAATAHCYRQLEAERTFLPFFGQKTEAGKKHVLVAVSQEYETSIRLARQGLDPYSVTAFVRSFSDDPALSAETTGLLGLVIDHVARLSPQSEVFRNTIELLVPTIHEAHLTNLEKDRLLTKLFDAVFARLDRAMVSMGFRDQRLLMSWLEGAFFSDEMLGLVGIYENAEGRVLERANALLSRFGNMPLPLDMQSRVMTVGAKLEAYMHRAHPAVVDAGNLPELVRVSSDATYRTALADVFPSQRAQVDPTLHMDQWDPVSVRRGLIDERLAWPRVEQALTEYLAGTYGGDEGHLLAVFGAFANHAIEKSGRPTVTFEKAKGMWESFQERAKQKGAQTVKAKLSTALDAFFTMKGLLTQGEGMLLQQLANVTPVGFVMSRLPKDGRALSDREEKLVNALIDSKTVTDAQRKKEIYLMAMAGHTFPMSVRRRGAMGLIRASRFGQTFENFIDAYVASGEQGKEAALYDMVSGYWQRMGQLPDDMGLLFLDEQKDNALFWGEFDRIFQNQAITPNLVTSAYALELFSLRYGGQTAHFMSEVERYATSTPARLENVTRTLVFGEDIQKLIPIGERQKAQGFVREGHVRHVERQETFELIRLGFPKSILAMPEVIRFLALRIVTHLPRDMMTSLISEMREIEAEEGRAEAMNFFFERTGLIKVGQTLSTMYGIIPDEERAVYARLQDKAPSSSVGDMERTVEEALGRPLEEVFADWDPVPVGSASMGEVYRARLIETGDIVYVKLSPDTKFVQNKAGIEALRLTGEDLREAVRMGRFGNLGIDVAALMRRMVRDLTEQLDFNQERANISQFARLGYQTPVVVGSVSRSRILVMEPVLGMPLNAMVEFTQNDRKRAAKQMGEQAIKMLFVDHQYHKDPHPGNVFFDPDSKQLTWLDFGVTGKIKKTQASQLLQLLMAVGTNNFGFIERVLQPLTTEKSREQSYDAKKFQQELTKIQKDWGLGEKIQFIIAAAGKAGLYLDPNILDAIHFLLVVNGVVTGLDPTHNLVQDFMVVMMRR